MDTTTLRTMIEAHQPGWVLEAGDLELMLWAPRPADDDRMRRERTQWSACWARYVPGDDVDDNGDPTLEQIDGNFARFDELDEALELFADWPDLAAQLRSAARDC